LGNIFDFSTFFALFGLRLKNKFVLLSSQWVFFVEKLMCFYIKSSYPEILLAKFPVKSLFNGNKVPSY